MQNKSFGACLKRVKSTEQAKVLLFNALANGEHNVLIDADNPGDLQHDVDLKSMLLNAKDECVLLSEDEGENLPFDELGPIFADAAWELCLEGILRPGPHSPNDASTSKAAGYSVTQSGRETLLLRPLSTQFRPLRMQRA